MFEIRELTHSDRAALTFALDHLGEQSRYQRYLTGYGPPMRVELRRLMTVDHWHHEVLIAEHVHPRIPIGVAEYVRGEAFDEAEIAIAISDAWQHQGVGRALTTELRDRAQRAGIRRFTATVLHDNRGAHALLQALSPTRTTRPAGSTSEIVVPLAA